MAHAVEPATGNWTAADLVKRFGPIPLTRLRHDPPPGTASEHDVVAIHRREDRLYELADGTLMEKTVGTYEAYLAMLFGRLLGNYAAENDLGIVLGADGMVRLAPGVVRIPDVSFISWHRLPGRKIPRAAIADLAPDLVVEVLSKSNTPVEMQRKLADYFAAKVRQVWYVDPAVSEIRVYLSPDRHTVLDKRQSLDGGDILPGFTLSLQQLFADPSQAAEA